MEKTSQEMDMATCYQKIKSSISSISIKLLFVLQKQVMDDDFFYQSFTQAWTIHWKIT